MEALVKPIFQVAAARSGTNLMGNILSKHQDIAFLYTPKYIWRHGNAWHPDDCLTARHARPRVIRYIHREFSRYTSKQGGKRYFDNTQSNVLALPFINAVFPDCKIFHIIRDGLDNAASQRYRFGAPTMSTLSAVRSRLPSVPIGDWPAYFPEFVQHVINRLKGEKYVYSMGPKIKEWKRLRREHDILEYVAINWRECVTAARSFGRTLPPDRYHEVRFEDLLSAPEEVLTRLLDFLELEPSARMTEFARTRIDPERTGKRRNALTAEERERVMAHIGGLLTELNMV